MRTLVIETATAACSVALMEDGHVLDFRHVVVGRGHAERLVPMIAELPDAGRADRILVDCGPGSFTGVRVGLAAARGLAIGWGAEVLGFSSLALVAAGGFAARPGDDTRAVVLEGGHGEVFVQEFTADPLTPVASFASLRPEAALERLAGRHAVGTGVHRLLALDPGCVAAEALPDARDARLLPEALATLPPRPLYGRAPDAKPPQA
ncbi:tRNA (adenosine(37)-N6)-threonylcarbamoyltransferase complex dimerization subunit type 1 TsaB [Sphingomonas sp. PL-96]|uniref:tRNA (adenosine(37)-N6)-threonylcarbamoyltransferase complex dimerization subunit type 1 TsaB n=1 Tax=Sphingomonas sp. PL-96 TaxID=2887201 RepID=UPI001E322C4E|nr:tRNA (adenosine(37)-N6)-threonylcarbamoyltransferase complex dimerization subunit type 1 TsaB [Sphingomonas sp. PL-96]MCC2978149.1 tRNA (adenosine(37)-N6)-threonylcarbamoyltransferase complex dimerization subunit type 1 TsaB [Sphingomonas sp. PL-96]